MRLRESSWSPFWQSRRLITISALFIMSASICGSMTRWRRLRSWCMRMHKMRRGWKLWRIFGSMPKGMDKCWKSSSTLTSRRSGWLSSGPRPSGLRKWTSPTLGSTSPKLSTSSLSSSRPPCLCLNASSPKSTWTYKLSQIMYFCWKNCSEVTWRLRKLSSWDKTQSISEGSRIFSGLCSSWKGANL